MKCSNCGADINQGMNNCPNCGAVVPKKKSSALKIVLIVLGVLALLAIIGVAVVVVLVGSFFKEVEKTINEAESKYTTTTVFDTTKVTTTKEITTEADGNNKRPEQNPVYTEDGDFLLAIEDVFTITGRGTVATGKITRGKVKVGDKVQIIGLDKTFDSEVTFIEIKNKNQDNATTGDYAGIGLKDISRSDIERGMVIIKPDSMKQYKKFKADLKMISADDGGRHTPIFNGYRPQVYVRTTDTTAVINFPEGGVESLAPGETLENVTVELVKSMPLEVGNILHVREGGRAVGYLTITELID